MSRATFHSARKTFSMLWPLVNWEKRTKEKLSDHHTRSVPLDEVRGLLVGVKSKAKSDCEQLLIIADNYCSIKINWLVCLERM